MHHVPSHYMRRFPCFRGARWPQKREKKVLRCTTEIAKSSDMVHQQPRPNLKFFGHVNFFVVFFKLQGMHFHGKMDQNGARLFGTSSRITWLFFRLVIGCLCALTNIYDDVRLYVWLCATYVCGNLFYLAVIAP
jgi:hypothetical protein